MQITVHKGTHRIGGCVTEIKTDSARIIIDFGSPLPPDTDADFDLRGVTTGAPDCDAVLITHYHGDHVGMYENIMPQIPVYIGKASKLILTVVKREVARKTGETACNTDRFKEYRAGVPLSFGDIKVTPYAVDHSAFDAHMFLIEAENKRILHTGDFRMHGAKWRKMPDLFEKYASDIDVLITEGTMLSRTGENVLTAYEMNDAALKLLNERKNVFVLCSSTDIDTLAEFYRASILSRKPFVVCDTMQRDILRVVTEFSRSSFYDFDRYKAFVYGDNMNGLMGMTGFCFMGRANYVTARVMEKFPNNTLVYSMWRGYLDKTHKAFDAHKCEFVDNAVRAGSKLEYLHTSGHATPDELKRVCDITKAKNIIPIHCENPRAFNELGVRGKVILPADGETVIV